MRWPLSNWPGQPLEGEGSTMKPVLAVAAVAAALVFLGWLGLRLQPSAYPPFEAEAPPLETRPLPGALPVPVERFYRQKYGDEVPVITSAVVSGRGRMAPFGVALPMRFRMLYAVGQDYRSEFQATFYRFPVMSAIETYIDGHGLGRMPMGIDEGAWFDQAVNVRVWCELLEWMPAALLSDTRVAWEPVDDSLALLRVPLGDGYERVVVRFDPATGRLLYFEAMKGRTPTEKLLWVNGIWVDQGKPWITLNIEELLYNVPVADAIRSAAE
jgi:hypothetical protein